MHEPPGFPAGACPFDPIGGGNDKPLGEGRFFEPRACPSAELPWAEMNSVSRT